jgi:peptide/nickel transport system ATP-binding protein
MSGRFMTTPVGVPVLEVTDLKVSFPSEDGEVTAVRGVTYSVAAGEVLGIVGESGSGKSVSSLAVMGLLPRSAKVGGSVRIQGEEVLGLTDAELSKIRGRTLSMIFQDPLSALTPVYTVGDQVAEAIRIHQGTSKQAAAARAVELLDLVGIPNASARFRAYPHEFSGGMRQRVMIAMAIANDPDLIIADEPTTALDVTIQAQVLEVLKTAKEITGAAIIMITHDLGVIAGFADRVMVMYAGKAVETATAADLYERPLMPYTLGLLGSVPRLDAKDRQRLTPIDGTPPSLINLPPGCPFLPRCPLAVDECAISDPDLLEVRLGHRAACHRSDYIEENALSSADVFTVEDALSGELSDTPRDDRRTVLAVNDLVRHFPLTKGAVFRRRVGTVYAVDRVTFEVREGETLALVGESGCGKTTTMMSILELTKPQSGSVEVLGTNVAHLGGRERKAIRRDLQVVFQDPMASLDPRMPISEIVTEPLRAHGVPRSERQARAAGLLSLVGLSPEHANRYPQEFSGGQRQRISIARALALEPKVLVLDEPVSALDVSIQAGVINLLDDLKARLGLAYVFVAHDLSVVRHIADRVAVMYLGKIVELGEVAEVFDSPAHPYTQALLSAIPLPDPRKERQRQRIILEGDLPSPANPPSGCAFRTRCPKHLQLSPEQQSRCIEVIPSIGAWGSDGAGRDHGAACHFAQAASVL